MSLLLKALKQAETAHAEKAAASGVGLELESLASSDGGKAREWVEPPGLLFGSSGLSPAPVVPARRFQMPQLSLVPATALLAAVVAIGYGIYLYFAMQPPAAIVTAATVSSQVSSQQAPSHPVDSSPPAAVPVPAVLPESEVAAAPRAPSLPPVMATSEARPPLSYPPTKRPARQAPSQAAPAFSFQPDTRSTLLNSAYAAYRKGQINEAQRLYTQAAARERSVDAVLGLATIAAVQNRDEEAVHLYREVLDRDPRNAAAQAALLDLLGNTDKQATESRLKTLIEREPGAHLYQTLGNLYAEQNRWDEAQAAYFEAYRAAPGNADYAFNLAVSLDRLHQGDAALPYYEKALSLGGTHRFERAQAESRIRQIKSLQ